MFEWESMKVSVFGSSPKSLACSLWCSGWRTAGVSGTAANSRVSQFDGMSDGQWGHWYHAFLQWSRCHSDQVKEAKTYVSCCLVQAIQWCHPDRRLTSYSPTPQILTNKWWMKSCVNSFIFSGEKSFKTQCLVIVNRRLKWVSEAVM